MTNMFWILGERVHGPQTMDVLRPRWFRKPAVHRLTAENVNPAARHGGEVDVQVRIDDRVPALPRSVRSGWHVCRLRADWQRQDTEG